MITHLFIKNFAIIESLDVDFKKGLNIITGETGAGKSIIIEAINLALGSRADTSYIRTGHNKAIISVALEITEPALVSFLNKNDIELEDDTLILSRELHSTGKSICKINSNLTTVSFLNKISKNIVDIHGQYDHQSLLNTEYHINFIDLYNSKEISTIKNDVALLFSEFSSIQKEYSSLIKNKDEAKRKEDFLKYEFEEITKANLKLNEDVELEQQIVVLQNSEKIYSSLFNTYELLYSKTDSALENIGKASSSLKEIAIFDKKLESFDSNLSDVLFNLDDVCNNIRAYKETINYSQELIDSIQERIILIDSFKRKYGDSIEKIIAHLTSITDDLALIENSDVIIEEVKGKLDNKEKQLHEKSLELSILRKRSATTIIQLINNELSELNFNDANFNIVIKDIVNSNDIITYSPSGIDLVEFMIATNKGEPEKPLTKIASGGEISRIMLALKTISSDADEISTLIFDEIDTGISGNMSSVVAQKLATISINHQVICVTHTAQIAAMADNHNYIEKNIESLKAKTDIRLLDDNDRYIEISRLVGGNNISQYSDKHAKEIISWSKTFKNSLNS